MNATWKKPVYLSLGSNLGDRYANLLAVEEKLPPKVKLLARSAIYQTDPWGFVDQPLFLNQVLMVETALSPSDLLAYLKNIEVSMGRTPSFRLGPRLVDIDILFYGNEIIQEDSLIIPHQHLKERAFVLIPLAEISPDLLYPGSDQTVSDLLQQVDTSGVDLFKE